MTCPPFHNLQSLICKQNLGHHKMYASCASDSKQIGEVLWHIFILIKKSKCCSPLIIPVTRKVLYLRTQSIIMLLLLLLYFLLLLSSLLSAVLLLTILLFHSITHLVTSYCDQLTIQAASRPFAFKTNIHSLSFLVQLTRP